MQDCSNSIANAHWSYCSLALSPLACTNISVGEDRGWGRGPGVRGGGRWTFDEKWAGYGGGRKNMVFFFFFFFFFVGGGGYLRKKSTEKGGRGKELTIGRRLVEPRG